MADDYKPQNDHIFRSNKRRKVFRRRAASDTDPDRAGSASTFGALEDGGIAADDREPVSIIRRAAKPGAVRKNGIIFSNTQERRTGTGEEAETSNALVPVSRDGAEDSTSQHERFVRPTGRTTVSEDKHMYVVVHKGVRIGSTALTA